MKKLSPFLLTAVTLLALLASSCTGKSSTSGGANVTGADKKFDMSLIKIKRGDKITLDSPDKFIQLYVLFVYEQTSWMEQIRSLTNKSTIEIFLSNKKAEFYNDFGISQSQFDDYSINHMNEINTFLDKNPDFKKLFFDSQKYLNQADVNS